MSEHDLWQAVLYLHLLAIACSLVALGVLVATG